MDLRDIEKAAREQGWRVEPNKKGHPVFYSPDTTKNPIPASGTPSDRRSINNLLRRAEAGRSGVAMDGAGSANWRKS